MIFLTLALLATQSTPTQAGDDWLARDMAARRIAREQAAPMFQSVISEWKACLIPQAKRMAASRDAADLVAVAALVACSEWESAIKVGLPAQLALNMTSMPYLDALKVAENNIDDQFGGLKAGMKDQLIELLPVPWTRG